ncbi:hypothetical protein QFZ57_003165 [Arthrobacter sp. B1I2]|nr:hypothetical protein [Arthrobacter sp. B1I2]
MAYGVERESGDRDRARNDAGLLLRSSRPTPVAGRGSDSRFHRDEPRPSRPGRLVGERGLLGRGPRPLLLGEPSRLSSHHHARPGPTPGPVLRRHLKRPGAGCETTVNAREPSESSGSAWAGVCDGVGREPFASASVNHGRRPSDAEEWLPDACPIVGSFGGSDNSPLGGPAGRRLGRLLTEFEVPLRLPVRLR